MRRSLTRLGLAGLLTLLLVACGGDDGLSDAAYFDALADVGADSAARLEPLHALFDGPEGGETLPLPDAETAVAFLDGLQALMAEARDAGAALAAPSDLAAANDAFVDAADAMIAQIERARGRVAAGELDFEAVFPEVETSDFRRACATLEQFATDRGFDLDLFCLRDE